MFTTLDNVKQFLNQTSSTDDKLLTRLITQAGELINTYLSRNILSQTYTDKFDGLGGDLLAFNENFPVTAIATLTINDQPIPAATSALGNGYTFDENSVSLVGYTFTRGRKNVVITYTAGLASIPSELEQVCIDLVANVYKERDRIGLDSKALAGETTVYATRDIPNRAKTVLKQYRRVA
jgi:hypothetical protein